LHIDKEFVQTESSVYYSFFIEYLPAVKRFAKSDLNSLNEVELRQYNSLREWQNLKTSGRIDFGTERLLEC